MTAKILKKSELKKVIKAWMKTFEVIAPVASTEGIHFKIIQDARQIDTGTERKSIYPPKSVFLPQSEVMFAVQDGDFQTPPQPEKQRIIFGMRPCDARSVWLLDTIFKTTQDFDLYWTAKREKALVITFGCASLCSTGFCDTVGSGPFGKEGSDILITELEDAYFLETLTKEGKKLVENLPEAELAVNKQASAVHKNSQVAEHKTADLAAIHQKLYASFDTPVWKEISASCLGCGVCTYLCPTCFCFDIVDETDRGERVRNWDTCMFRIYSQEASGHNPRSTKAERTRQRIMHKFAYWFDNEALSGCTGCGRCVALCPVNLDIREMIKSVTGERVQ